MKGAGPFAPGVAAANGPGACLLGHPAGAVYELGVTPGMGGDPFPLRFWELSSLDHQERGRLQK